ncbi:MAG: hypothetical protein RL311_336 [Bacteroidota bacterium]
MLLSILVFAGCAGQKKTDQNETKIEYKAYSRGFYKVIIIENQMGFVTKMRDDKPIVFRPSISDRKSLNIAIQELDLESLSQLKAPTDKRLFDGTAIANLKITKQGKTFETQSFDHGYPPAEIQKIVNKTLSFVK